MEEYGKTLPARHALGLSPASASSSVAIAQDQTSLSEEDPTLLFELLHPLGVLKRIAMH